MGWWNGITICRENVLYDLRQWSKIFCSNISSIIASHNRIIIQTTFNNHGCNGRNRAKYPIDNKCLTANIVYNAVVSAHNKLDKKYFGIAETSFKNGFRKHKRDFCPKKTQSSIMNQNWVF